MRREEIHHLADVAVKDYNKKYSIKEEDPDYKDLDMSIMYKIGFWAAISRVLQAQAEGKDIKKEFEDVLT